MPPNNNQKVTNTSITDGKTTVNHATLYSGPIPPAAEFEKFEKVLPGSANRILVMSEKQSSHRRLAEKIVVITDAVRALAGTIIGGIVAVGGVGGGFYLIANDKPIEGFASMLTALAPIVGIFIYREYTEDKK